MSIQLFRKHSKAVLDNINLVLPTSKHLQKRFNQSDLFRAFAIRCPVESLDEKVIDKLVDFRASIGIKDKYICGQCPFQKECKLAFNKKGEDSNIDFDVNSLSFYFQQLSKLDDNTYNSILSARTSQYKSPQEEGSDKHFIYWGATLRILDTLGQIQRDIVDNNGEFTQQFIKQNELYTNIAQEQSEQNSQNDTTVTKRSKSDQPTRKVNKDDTKFDEKKSFPYNERSEQSQKQDSQNNETSQLQGKFYEKRQAYTKDNETYEEKKPRHNRDNSERESFDKQQQYPQRTQSNRDENQEIPFQNKRNYENNTSRNFENSNARNFENKQRNYDNSSSFENRSNDRGQGNYPNNRNYENRSNDRGQGNYPNSRNYDNRSNDRGQGNYPNNRNYDNRSNDRGQGNYPNNRGYEGRSNDRGQDNYPNNRGYEGRPSRNYENSNRNYDNNRNFDNRSKDRNFDNKGYDNRRESNMDDRKNFSKKFDEQASFKEELNDYERLERDPQFKREFVKKFSSDSDQPELDSFETRRQSKRGQALDSFSQDRSPPRNNYSKYVSNNQDAGQDLGDNSFESFQKEQQSNQKNESYKVTPNDSSDSRPNTQREGGRNIRQGKFRNPNSE